MNNRAWRKQRNRVLRRDKWMCCYCTQILKKNGRTRGAVIDHIIPKALGGADYLTNLQTLCQYCNHQKTRIDLKKIKELRK